MKKLSLLLWMALVIPCIHLFAGTPLAEFSNHTKVLDLAGGSGVKNKVIILENPDSTVTIAIISDAQNQITKESLKSQQDGAFPYRSQLVYGNRYHFEDTENGFKSQKVATIYNGIDDSEPGEELTKSVVSSVKDWVYTKNNAVYTLNADGNGTVKYTLSSEGYAQQSYDSRAVGSNQYQTKFKNNYSGGVTGGYTFSVEVNFSSKVEWFIVNTEDGKMLAVNQKGNPTVISTKVYTSLDDDPSKKEWLKSDTKRNYEVNQAKEALLDRRPATFHEVVKVYKNQFILLKDGTMLASAKQKSLLTSLDNVEEDVQAVFKAYDNNFRYVLGIDWYYRHLDKNKIVEMLKVMTGSKSGNYAADFIKAQSPFESYSQGVGKGWKNYWRYYEINRLSDISKEDIESNTNLSKELAFVSEVEVVDYKLDSTLIGDALLGGDTVYYYDYFGKYTCHFHFTNSLGYPITKATDVCIRSEYDQYTRNRYYFVLINKSFTYVNIEPGEYEYLTRSVKAIKSLEDSLRASIPEEPVFANFDKKTYSKYNLKLTKKHDDNKARIDKMLEYQHLLLTGIKEYDATIVCHQKALEASANIPDVSKVYAKYAKSVKLIWDAGEPQINLASEREIMSGCVDFCNERNNLSEKNQQILNGYSQYKNILKAYMAFYKGLDLAWTPGESTKKLVEAEGVQDAFIRSLNAADLNEKDKAIGKSKDKSLNAVLDIIK